jgi:hypothetical protein
MRRQLLKYKHSFLVIQMLTKLLTKLLTTHDMDGKSLFIMTIKL